MRHSVLLLALLAACRHQEPEQEAAETAPAAVKCVAVATTDVQDAIEVHGVIAPEPKLDAIVSSPVAGRVSRVTVEEGDSVAAGAVLATVEDPALPADSASARASVASAQAAKEAADQELTRQQRLVATGIGARRDLDEARAKARAADAELTAANARAGLASQRLARRELRAPHAGVILHVWKRAGESVDGTSATPIVEIADLTNLELRAQLSGAALGKLHEGMKATIHTVGRGEPLVGAVVRVAPAVDPATLLGTVRIRLPVSAGATVGTAASAFVELGQHPGIQVPPTALRRSSVGADELVVCDHGKAAVRTVTVGTRTDALVEIVQGLAAGDQIVIDHVLGLEDGQQLVGSGNPP